MPFQPVGVHTHVAHSHRRARVQFAFECDIPLGRLRIAVMRIGSILHCAAAQLHQLARGNRIRELDDRLSIGAQFILERMDVSLGIAQVIIRQLSEAGHGINAEARAEHRFVVVEWPVCHGDARVYAALVKLAQSCRQARLAVGENLGAGKAHIPIRQTACIEPLEEPEDRPQTLRERVGYDDRVCLRVEVRHNALLFRERRLQFPPQAYVDREAVAGLPFIAHKKT